MGRSTPPRGQQDARTVLAGLKSHPENKTCVFISTSRKHEGELSDLLDEMGFVHELQRSKAGYALLLVHLNETGPGPAS